MCLKRRARFYAASVITITNMKKSTAGSGSLTRNSLVSAQQEVQGHEDRVVAGYHQFHTDGRLAVAWQPIHKIATLLRKLVSRAELSTNVTKSVFSYGTFM
jgi:hypothetical protein